LRVFCNDDIENSANVSAEVNNITNWCSRNGLTLNLKKTKLIYFSKSNRIARPIINLSPHPIQIVDELRLLGVNFAQNQKWDSHFNKVSNVFSSRLRALQLLKGY
jgi:hypothetical protein